MRLKMVQNQLEACRCLIMALGKGRARTLARRLHTSLAGPGAPADQGFDAGALLALLKRRLGLERAELVAASESYLALAHDLKAQLAARDRSVAELRSALVAASDTLRGLFGGAGARAMLGSSGRTPEAPEALSAFGRALFERLTGPGAELPRPLLPGVELDPLALGASFEDALIGLERSLDRLGLLRQRAAAARQAKDAALARVTMLTRWAQRLLVVLGELAVPAPQSPAHRRATARDAES